MSLSFTNLVYLHMLKKSTFILVFAKYSYLMDKMKWEFNMEKSYKSINRYCWPEDKMYMLLDKLKA